MPDQDTGPDDPTSVDGCGSERAAWRHTVTRLLREHALDAAHWLGEGEEAEVYALGLEQVLRIQKQPADRALVHRRRAFYSALDRTRVAFEVPSILTQGEFDGICWSVERRIAGSSLAETLPRLEGQARQRALLGYADVAAAISKLGCAQDGYGEVLAASPIRAATWADFVLARAGACLGANRHRLEAQVNRPTLALHRLGRMLAACGDRQPQLVHGDFYPANVLVREDGQVSGLIDFGPSTVMGDALMDAAGAVLYLAGMAGITAQDRQIVLERAREHGLGDEDLALYRLFYAFRFLDTPRDGVWRWCIESIRSACYG